MFKNQRESIDFFCKINLRNSEKYGILELQKYYL